MVGGVPADHDGPSSDAPVGHHQETRAVRTIKLCASSSSATTAQHQTTLLEAIRRSALEIERTGRGRRPLPLPAGHTATALA
jgi:hypothetical protein